MFRSLSTAATGMEAQQTRLDVTAHNIANVSTNGYKKERAEFADLMYQTVRAAGSATGNGTNAPDATEIGLGTRLTATTRELTQGELHQTGNPLDVAIEGHGYLPITMPSGETAYTRNGALHMTAEGRLVNSEGYSIAGDITIPTDAQQVTIGADGTVSAVMAARLNCNWVSHKSAMRNSESTRAPVFSPSCTSPTISGEKGRRTTGRHMATLKRCPEETS